MLIPKGLIVDCGNISDQNRTKEDMHVVQNSFPDGGVKENFIEKS